MKKIEIVISKILIIISFYLTRFLKIKKKRVSVISYFNSEYGLEFTKLVNLLANDNYEVKTSLHHFRSNWSGKLRYLFSFIYQTYLFNTSKLILLDGNSYVYTNIKVKKAVKVVQLWHATGAIKKFGQETKRRYQIKGYHSLIVSSSFFKPIFAQALNTDLANVHALGVCKTDYLFDDEYLQQSQKEFYDKYPQLKEKKIILYAPTFRGEGIEDIEYTGDIEDLAQLLGDSYVVLLKLHPLIKKKVSNDFIIDVSNDQLYGLLNVADYVISDYSALVFDAMILKKKVILYLYDLADYQKERGLCLDLDTLNLQKSYTINDIYDIIIKQDIEEINQDEFIYKYLSAIDGQSTIKIFKHLKQLSEME